MAAEPGDLSGRPLLATSLDQALFVDREEELGLVERSVARRANALVLGRRRSGKTSFLHRVALDLDKGGRQTILVSGAPAATVAELLELVALRLRRYVNLGWAGLDRSEPAGLIAQIQSLQPQSDPERELVILLDEVASVDVAHTLFGRLRDELWRLPYTWVVADDDTHRAAYLRPPADAFFGTVVELPDLSRDQSLELLRRRLGVELSDVLLAEIVKLGSGHPGTLIGLAREVVLSENDADHILDERMNRRLLVAELGTPAARVVDYIEEFGPVSASDKEFLASLGWTRNRATQVLNELAREGVLAAHVEKGGRKKIFTLAPAGR